MSKFTRAETLQCLKSMGVELPADTKLTDDALDKRFKKAINATQSLSTVAPDGSLDLASLPAWPPTSSENLSVFAAINRGDFNEYEARERAKQEGRKEYELWSNAFYDLRQTLLSIAMAWDQGRKALIASDRQGEHWAINIRLLAVHKFNKRTPVVVLLYKYFSQENALQGIQWAMYNSGKTERDKFRSILCTDIEGKMLLRFLAMNTSLVPKNYKFHREEYEDGFQVSVLLPVGPLGYDDIGKLNADPGCAVCGASSTSRCSQCQSVAYCSTSCQRKDWPQHKQFCRSLKGGLWVTLPFNNQLYNIPGTEPWMMSRHNAANGTPFAPFDKPDNKTPQANKHGDKVFLVKIQLSEEPSTLRCLLTYDRQRSVLGYSHECNCLEVFRRLEVEMKGPRGGYAGRKMYRWAKRTGEFELSVCLDREPQGLVKW